MGGQEAPFNTCVAHRVCLLRVVLRMVLRVVLRIALRVVLHMGLHVVLHVVLRVVLHVVLNVVLHTMLHLVLRAVLIVRGRQGLQVISKGVFVWGGIMGSEKQVSLLQERLFGVGRWALKGKCHCSRRVCLGWVNGL